MLVKDAHVSTAPIAWKDSIIVGVDNGLLMAVSPKDGKSIWKTDCHGYIAPTPAMVEGYLVVGSERTVYGLDPDNGKTKWVSMLTSGAKQAPSMMAMSSSSGAWMDQCRSLDVTNGHFRWRATAPTSRRRTRR